jgi:hypothetical protein
MNRVRRPMMWVAAAIVAVAGLAACGDDDGGASATTQPPAPSPSTTQPPVPSPSTTQPPVPSPSTSQPPAPFPSTTDGGGGMQAGAPQFTSFTVSDSVPCANGNATATMSFTTMNVVEIEIKVGDGAFATTAGYGPNESAVVASIPCQGAGTSSIQLRGCTENHTCVDSPRRAVQITP